MNNVIHRVKFKVQKWLIQPVIDAVSVYEVGVYEVGVYE